MADDESDAAGALVGLGLLVLVGVGLYRVLKSVAEYEEAQLINAQQAAQLAKRMERARNYVPTPNCEIHGANADLCPMCHNCIECNPPMLSYSSVCYNCDY